MIPLLSGVQEVLIYYTGHGTMKRFPFRSGKQEFLLHVSSSQESDLLLSGEEEVLIYYIGHGVQEGDSLTVRSTRSSYLLHCSRKVRG